MVCLALCPRLGEELFSIFSISGRQTDISTKPECTSGQTHKFCEDKSTTNREIRFDISAGQKHNSLNIVAMINTVRFRIVALVDPKPQGNKLQPICVSFRCFQIVTDQKFTNLYTHFLSPHILEESIVRGMFDM